MGVEPDDARPLRRVGGESADRGDAVTGQEDRQGVTARRNRRGNPPHQLEGGANLRGPRTGREVNAGGSDNVTVAGKSAFDAGLDEPLRPGSHPRTAMTRVVRHNEELEIHPQILRERWAQGIAAHQA